MSFLFSFQLTDIDYWVGNGVSRYEDWFQHYSKAFISLLHTKRPRFAGATSKYFQLSLLLSESLSQSYAIIITRLRTLMNSRFSLFILLTPYFSLPCFLSHPSAPFYMLFVPSVIPITFPFILISYLFNLSSYPILLSFFSCVTTHCIRTVSTLLSYSGGLGFEFLFVQWLFRLSSSHRTP